MMLFKLSVKNLKKSMKDYMIYFVTLIIGVAIFYIFNALEKQTIMLQVGKSTQEVIGLMKSALSATSVFVAFVLGFLIVYASNFLMKRRKKEFGTYMILGMSKKNISLILFTETVILGIISLVAGLALGIMISQGMSVVVANMFEANMTKFRFVISGNAIVKTLIYFCIMYIVVIVMNTFIVGRTKLISLLNSGKRREKNVAKNPALCIIVFVVGTIILATAYYAVTTGMNDIKTEGEFVLQIAKGIISTVMIFWSISGMFTFISKKCKRFYHNGLNSFTVKELESRINTTVFSGSIICLMLFITICILSTSMAVKKEINDNLKKMTPADINISVDTTKNINVEEKLAESGLHMNMLKDKTVVRSYNCDVRLYDMIKGAIVDADDYYKEYCKQVKEEIIKVGEYNRIAKLYGNKQFKLNDDEYIVVADYENMVENRNVELKNNPVIKIGEKEYRPKFDKCQDGYILMASNHSNMGFILVPDDADLSGCLSDQYYFAANYNAKNAEEKEHIDKDIENNQEKNYNSLQKNIDSDTLSNIQTKSQIKEYSIGMTAMGVFIGIYLGVVFMVSGAAILALKELSEAVDNKEKYEVLRKIGVDNKDISDSIFAQCTMFFGLPLIIASVHSIFGIRVCYKIMSTFGSGGGLYSIIVTAVIIAVIYGVYFIITYYCSKKIVE